MSNQASETEPLLSRQASTRLDGQEVPRKARVGPLEISRSTRYGILAGIWSATFLSALNSTLVPTMLPSISSEFEKFNQASWLGTSYLLATCTFTPLYGRLCNVLGRKGASQLALLFTCLGVLGCGLSPSMTMLIVSRFLSGIGGGGLFTVSSIIVSDMYTMRDRGLTQGLASVFGGLGMGIGGPFGGIITDWLGWRWAFLIQLPLFFVSFALTSHFHHYVTPGKGKSTKEVLKRIDYGGSFMLLITVGALLIFLSARYNEGLRWSNPTVIVSVSVAAVCAVAFLLVELFLAREPVLAPFLLKQRIPVLVGTPTFSSQLCIYGCVGMSFGSIFAGYMMHRTGRYKAINLICGWFPFIGASLIASLHKDSSPYLTWLSILPLGFGNAVVLQTMLIALLVHLPESQMAVGTGFGQLFRGIGQVGGVAISSAIFQSKLDIELRQRIHGPDAEEIIMKIRRSSQHVATLPSGLQTIARESYAISLKAVFIFSACSTLLAFLVRSPIPDKYLDQREKDDPFETDALSPSRSTNPPIDPESAVVVNSEGDDEDEHIVHPKPRRRGRRLSTFESAEGGMDLERDNNAAP